MPYINEWDLVWYIVLKVMLVIVHAVFCFSQYNKITLVFPILTLNKSYLSTWCKNLSHAIVFYILDLDVVKLNCIHLSDFVCGFFRLQGLMKMERHQFNYNVLVCYRGEIVFIWRLNEFLISLLLTWCYLGLKWGSSQLHGFVLIDGQVFVPLLRQITFANVRGKMIVIAPQFFQAIFCFM